MRLSIPLMISCTSAAGVNNVISFPVITFEWSAHLELSIMIYLFQWFVIGTVKMEESAFLLMSANANQAGTDQHVTQVQGYTCHQVYIHNAST